MLLNCDMGESEQLWFHGNHKELIALVDQVSISCGAHAGSELLIKETILEAKVLGKSIGAHPSYPDKENFGRKSLPIPLDELLNSLQTQLKWFSKSCGQFGANISYVKPHGALYHDCITNSELRAGLFSILEKLNLKVPLMLMANTNFEGNYIKEAFVDRQYENATRLLSRGQKGSLIEIPKEALAQYLAISHTQKVHSTSDGVVSICAESCCIHSDTSSAYEIALEIVKYNTK